MGSNNSKPDPGNFVTRRRNTPVSDCHMAFGLALFFTVIITAAAFTVYNRRTRNRINRTSRRCHSMSLDSDTEHIIGQGKIEESASM
jgi:hypothetical protein